MYTPIIITLGVLGCLAILFIVFANNCFDDVDPDLFFYNEYQVVQCPHKGEKLLKVVDTSVTCETTYTICSDCREVLSEKTDCL